MKPKILLIEDQVIYQRMTQSMLGDQFELDIASNGEEAFRLIQDNRYDLFLVDIMLPDVSGLQICTHIRSQKETVHTPILIVTSKEDTEDKIQGFNFGADDYIVKPFHAKEFVMRINSRLKRTDASNSKIVRYENLKIDLQRQSVEIDGQPIEELTRIEFKLLTYFAQHVDHVLSREQIIVSIWGDNHSITERTVDSHISNLRSKLQGSHFEISTVYASGYRFRIQQKKAKAS